ncbi:MAG: NADP-specific glutamate dehydrogenase [bacterium]
MSYVHDVLEDVYKRNAAQPEFLQAVQEVFESLGPVLKRYPKYRKNSILERLAVPDRMIIFRVGWIDDKGRYHIHRGYRIQFNNMLGPYKGGLRFHPTVYLGVLKFLGFEQTFKNALSALNLGGAKGGSDFDPKGRSNNEVMRFCQSFMTELFRHIGPHTDVPAGDIGVGGREIGYLFGQYKRLANEFTGTLTGKNPGWGGSHIRPEATGYGVTYFAEEMLKTRGESLAGKICTVSGSGNVAQFLVERVTQYGGKCISMSDSDGTIYDRDGINEEKLKFIVNLKTEKRGRIREYAEKFKGVEFRAAASPWSIPCDCAFPCATQNELSKKDAERLVKHGCTLVAEGANMPTEPEGVKVFLKHKILYAPGKAANAGGVVTSAFEMAQNAQYLNWTREEVDARLKQVMVSIHDKAHATAAEYGHPDNYVMGANIAGFVRVADAMVEQGIV